VKHLILTLKLYAFINTWVNMHCQTNYRQILILLEIIYSSNFESGCVNLWPTIKHFLLNWTKGYL